MIKTNHDIIVEINSYLPYSDSKETLLEELHKLLSLIHKEPNCLNYELFLGNSGEIVSLGRFRNALAYNLHKNMHYIEEFKRKILPVLCERFESKTLKEVTPPLTALSLLNER